MVQPSAASFEHAGSMLQASAASVIEHDCGSCRVQERQLVTGGVGVETTHTGAAVLIVGFHTEDTGVFDVGK